MRINSEPENQHISCTAQAVHLEELPSIPALLVMEADTLSRYYFSVVCIINSGFDSRVNPFRVYVAESMSSSPVIYHSMLSMSAAHLYQQNKDLIRVALEHRTEAIACMRIELSRTDRKSFAEEDRNHRTATLLLGTLLLGMSSVSL